MKSWMMPEEENLSKAAFMLQPTVEGRDVTGEYASGRLKVKDFSDVWMLL